MLKMQFDIAILTNREIRKKYLKKLLTLAKNYGNISDVAERYGKREEAERQKPEAE